MAQMGNVAAAETYLNHMRFILTDERIIRGLTAMRREVALRQASEEAREVLAFVSDARGATHLSLLNSYRQRYWNRDSGDLPFPVVFNHCVKSNCS